LTPMVPGPRGLDGHGAILLDPQAIDLTVETIATRRVPPDTRSQALIDAAQRQSRDYQTIVLLTLCVLTIGLCTRVIDRNALAGAVMPLAPERVATAIEPPEGESPRTGDPRGSLLTVRATYEVPMPLGFVGLPTLTVSATATRRIEWTP